MQKTADIILLLVLFLFPAILPGQTPANTDSLYQKAQERAFSGEYEYSRQLCRQILQVEPGYTDATVLMGRTYAWQEQFDSARIVLRPLVQQVYPPADAYVALAAVELWNGFPQKALTYSSKGLELYPASVSLLLSKAYALRNLQDYTAVEELVANILQLAPGNKEAEIILRQLKDQQSMNRIKAFYQLSAFKEDLAPWHLGTLEYQRSAAKGNYLLRFNYAEQFEKHSIQAELDVYPKLGRKTYAYLNVGVSDRNLFPAYKLGAEVFHVLPAKVEVSLGGRGLFFAEETVVLYTGHIGKYFSKYWLAVRPYLREINGHWEFTGTLQLRHYLQQEDAFIGLIMGKGSMPVVPVGIQEIARLDAGKFGLEGQVRVGAKLMVGGMLSYELEELLRNSFRHRFSTGISIQQKF